MQLWVFNLSAGIYLMPSSNGAFSQTLSNGKLQIENRNTLDGQHYEIGH